MHAAVASHVSWGFLCCCSGQSQGDYSTGYQCPPVDWRMESSAGDCTCGAGAKQQQHSTKKDFAEALKLITSGGLNVSGDYPARMLGSADAIQTERFLMQNYQFAL